MLGPLRPMTDWEAMTVVQFQADERVFETLCEEWQRGALNNWQDVIDMRRVLSDTDFDDWCKNLSIKSGAPIKDRRELPQPPFGLR